MGGTSPINGESMPTKMVLQQKDRHGELEPWQAHSSEGRCI